MRLYFSIPLALVVSICHAVPQLTPAQIQQIEGIAQDIAARTNANIKANPQSADLPRSASAQGRNVTFVYYINLRPGVSQEQLTEWRRLTEAELIPSVCKQNANNPAFPRGLSYTYDYQTRDGNQLGKVFIDQAKCMRTGY